jgi:putative oxidoreductase
MNLEQRVSSALVWLRYGVFLVMLMWTLDKFFNPGHASKVFKGFYGISIPANWVLYGLGPVELLIILAFVAGLWKTWTYGTVLVLHGISTFSSYAQYMDPFNNLLFFAAWPMLAGCYVLFVLRDLDNRWTISMTSD